MKHNSNAEFDDRKSVALVIAAQLLIYNAVKKQT